MSAPEMRSAGARASAAAAMCALGGAAVVVRVPVPPVADSVEEELGLAAPEFRDLLLRPCAVRTRQGRGCDVLLAASVVESMLGVSDANAVKGLLAGAAFVQLNGEAMLLEEVQARQVGGAAYLYRLRLREATAEVRR